MEEPQTQDTTGTAPRWFQRALPMGGLFLALAALAALLVPGFRDQVSLSTTRQPQPFVEMYLPQSRPAHDAVCGNDRSEARFVVTSHLVERQSLRYRVEWRLPDRVEPVEVRTGRVRLDPEQTRQVRASVPDAPAEPHTVVVRLPRHDQLLRVHCPGDRS